MNQKMTFEQALTRLDEIVNGLESGELPLEESLKLFEEGSALATFCYGKLAGAEQKIKKISGTEEKDGAE